MNKNLIISLLVLVVILLGATMVIQKSNTANQEAASLRSQNRARNPNPNANPNANPATLALACNVSVTSNPPVLPSTSIPNAPFSAQQVIGVFSVTSNGCAPGDVFFARVKMLIIASNLGATRMDNFNIKNLTTGISSPSVDIIYGPVTTVSLKPGFDVSANGTTTFEVSADLNLNMAALVPGVSNIITVMDNFDMYNTNTLAPVAPNVGGLTSQQLTY